MAIDPYELELRQRLGVGTPEGGGRDWFQPIRTFFGATQGVIPRALSGLFPETYRKAQEQTREMMGVAPEGPWYEQVEAAPGAGDILAQVVPETVAESAIGRAVGPVARMVGNILGDPTTYTPIIAVKAAKGIAGGSKVGAAALQAARASTLQKTVEATRAADLGQIAGREAAEIIKTAHRAEIGQVARALATESPIRSKAFLTAHAIKEAEPLALGTAAAVAYGPQVIGATVGGAKETLEAAAEGDVEDALVSGANTALMAGLGALMGKGLMDAAKAKSILQKHFADQGLMPDVDKLVRERAEAMVEPPTRFPEGPSLGPEEVTAYPIERPVPEWAPTRPVPEELPRTMIVPEMVPPSRGPIEIPEGFRGRAPERPIEEMRALGEAPQAYAREAEARARREPFGAARLPELGMREEEALAAMPEMEMPLGRGRGLPPQRELPLEPMEVGLPPHPVTSEELARVRAGLEAPRPEPTPRRRPAKGKQGRLGFEEGEPVLSAKEREEAEIRRVFAEVPDQYNRMVRDEFENAITEEGMASYRREEKGAAKFNKAVRERDPKDPVWQKIEDDAMRLARERVDAKLRQMYRTAKTPDQLPAARLKEMEYERLEKEGMTGEIPAPRAPEEVEVGEVLGTGPPRPGARPAAPPAAAPPPVPAPRPAPPVPAKTAPAVAPEPTVIPAKPTPVVPAAEAPAVPVPEAAAPTPSPVEVRARRTVEEWADHVIQNKPKMAEMLGANRERFVAKIRELQARWVEENPTPKSVEEIETGMRKAAHGAANALRDEIEAEKPAPVGKTVAEEVAEEVGEVGSAIEPGRLVKPVKKAAGEVEAGSTVGSWIKGRKEGKKREVGEATRRWAGLRSLRGAKGESLEGMMRPFVEGEFPDSAGRVGKGIVLLEQEGRTPLRLNDERRQVFLDYNAALRDVEGKVEWANRAAAVREATVQKLKRAGREVTEESVEKALGAVRNDIDHIERELSKGLMEREAGETGRAMPESAETVFDFTALKAVKVDLDKILQEAMSTGKLPDGFIERYWRFAKVPRPRRRGQQVEAALGNGMLHAFLTKLHQLNPEQVGRVPTMKEGTEPLLRALAKAAGIDWKSLDLRVPTKKAPAPTRVIGPLPGWTVKGKQEVSPNGTTVTRLPKGEVHVDAAKDADSLYQDLTGMTESGAVARITYAGKVVPKGWRAAVTRMLEDHADLVHYEEIGERDWLVVDKHSVARMEPEEVLRREKPSDQLTGFENFQRNRHHLEDEANGIDIGDGERVVDHDRMTDRGYQVRVAEVGTPVAKVARKIVEDLVGILGPKTKIRFAGLTTSPYARGLYHETRGEGARVYLNVVDAIWDGKTREEAKGNVVHALIHEVAHLADVGHESVGFRSTADYLEQLVKAQGRFDDYVKQLDEVLTEDVYRQVRDELGEQHRAMRAEINGESWRAGREQAVEGVPAGPAPRRVTAEPYFGGGGAKAPPGRGGGGIQRGGAVPGGVRGETGGLLGPAAPERGAAPGRAEGEAARSTAWSDLGEDEAAIARLEPREEVGQKEAADLIRRLSQGKPLRVSAMVKAIADWADQASRTLTDDQVQALLKTAPEPRGRPGVLPGGINMLVGVKGISDRAKAKMVLFHNMMTESGVADRAKPMRWEDADSAVREMLNVKSKEEWTRLFQRTGGGLDPTHDVLMRTIRDEYERQLEDIGKRMEVAAERGDQEEFVKLYREYETTKRNGAAASQVAMDMGTGHARALAFRKQAGLEMDPVKMLRATRREQLVELLRTRLKDTELAGKRADELLDMIDEVLAGRVEGTDFMRALRAALRKPGVFGGTWAGIRDQFLEFFKAGLLGWPSEVANVSSNAIFRGSRYLEDSIAGMLDAGLLKAGLVENRSIYVGEAAVKARAFRRALAEGLPALGKSELNLLKLKGGDIRQLLEEGALIQDLMGSYGAIPGKFGNFVRFHFDSMQNWDNFFKHLSRMDTLYSEIYRGLRDQGDNWMKGRMRTGESLVEATTRIADEVLTNRRLAESGGDFDPKVLMQSVKIFKKADELARRDTFQARLGAGAMGVQNWLSAHPMSGMIVPFYRTPTNILKETLTRTPIGFFQAAKKWSKLSQAERMQELSKPILGTMTMGLFATMAMNGEITGGGPLSFEEREALKATGWQPYSIRVGDQWMSYQRLEPLSSLIGMAADAVESWRSGARGAELAQKAADAAAENLANKTFWSGISALAGATSDPKRELGEFLKQFEGSLVPNSLGFAPFGHLARAMDPVYRQQESMTLDPVLAKLPFVSETLPVSYGPTGEPRMRPGYTLLEKLVSPFARSQMKEGPMAKGSEELVRVMAVPKAPMRYWSSPQGFRVWLKPEERQLLARSIQEATTLIGQRLLNDPYYKALPKDENDPGYEFGQMTQQKMVQRILDKYRSRALKRIMPALKTRTREVYRESRAEA